jgi:hypothetical protein
VIQVLLAQTEQRLVATLDRYVNELVAMRGELAAVLVMLDRSQFTYLCYTPEVPPVARDRAYASGHQRFAAWRGAVARVLKASGQRVPWPLADPEGRRKRRPGVAWRPRDRTRQWRGRPTIATGWGLTHLRQYPSGI